MHGPLNIRINQYGIIQKPDVIVYGFLTDQPGDKL